VSRPETRHVVVLGANSFSGQDFVNLMLDDPECRITGISRSPEKSSLFSRIRQHPSAEERYEFLQIDLNTEIDRLLAFFDEQRPTHIVNFAAQSEVAPSWQHPEHWYQTNCVALARMLNHLRQQSYLERFLQVSSPEIYGTCEGIVREDAPANPSTPYAASKAAADALLDVYTRQYGFPVLKVRATNVYGPRQQLFKIIPRSVVYILGDRRIPLHGGGHAVKSYIHIRDVSRGERDILLRGEIGQTYHLSPDKGVAVRDVVATIAELMERRFEDVTEVVDERPGQDAAYVIDSTRARDAFGWSPEITLSEGLAEVIAWVKEHRDEIEQQPLNYIHRA